MPQKARILLHIYGRVQGVFFRAETQQKALGLGLTGWVRNNSNGSVQIVAEGEKDKVEELVTWCEQGSEAASVDNLDTNWLPYSGEFEDFTIKY